MISELTLIATEQLFEIIECVDLHDNPKVFTHYHYQFSQSVKAIVCMGTKQARICKGFLLRLSYQ